MLSSSRLTWSSPGPTPSTTEYMAITLVMRTRTPCRRCTKISGEATTKKAPLIWVTSSGPTKISRAFARRREPRSRAIASPWPTLAISYATTSKSPLRMCDQGYDVPKRSDVSCDSLGSTVSTLMDVLGAIVLHEYTHFDRIGKAATGTHIGDKKYGPLDVRGLSDADKLINADSYRWLALEYYWTTVCGKTFSGPRDDRDNDESACQPGKCIVQ